MAHWAEVDDEGVVLRVIVCEADDGQDGTLHPPAFCTDVLGGRWVRTYYATKGQTFAGIGYRWDGEMFTPPALPEQAADAAAEALGAIDMLETREVLLRDEAELARSRAEKL